MDTATRTTLELVTCHASMTRCLSYSLRKVAASPHTELSPETKRDLRRIAANLEEAAEDLFAVGEVFVEL